MSEIKVNSIKGVAASTAALTINNTDGTCTANLTNRTNKNLVLNGAFLVAQRGVSSTSTGYNSVDRFPVNFTGTDEAPTQEQADVAAGTTPYSLGFRKCLKITNGNQTSGAGADDYIYTGQKFEAQNIASSGWNYVSASSFITLSFWVKSSVAQNFYGYIRTHDNPKYNYPFETGSLSADTWTKITKTISGNSNLVIDNDANTGFELVIAPFFGTNDTGSVTLNQWGAWDSTERVPDYTTTWYTTNNATFEITGVQLEVSDHATDFEHRSFNQELQLCKRYYEVLVSGSGKTWGGAVVMYHANETHHQCNWVEKRATPSLEYVEGTNYYSFYGNSTHVNSNRPTQMLYANKLAGGIQTTSSYLSGSLLQGGAAFSYTNNASSYFAVSAEL